MENRIESQIPSAQASFQPRCLPIRIWLCISGFVFLPEAGGKKSPGLSPNSWSATPQLFPRLHPPLQGACRVAGPAPGVSYDGKVSEACRTLSTGLGRDFLLLQASPQPWWMCGASSLSPSGLPWNLIPPQAPRSLLVLIGTEHLQTWVKLAQVWSQQSLLQSRGKQSRSPGNHRQMLRV